ncbi:hypothetical protein D9M72_229860 [compost metagenome]
MPACLAKVVYVTEAVTSSKVRADCEPSICTNFSFFGFDTTSSSAARWATPGFSPISPMDSSSSRARPVFTGSLGTAIVAPSGTGSPFLSFLENRPMVVE